MATDDTASPGVLARPQPLGVFGLPAGYLLIPADPAFDEARLALVAGHRPAAFPAGLAWYERALDGDLDGALAGLPSPSPSAAGDGADPLLAANRLVLDPSPDAFLQLRADAAALADPAFAAHVDTLGFILGLLPEPPDLMSEAVAGDAPGHQIEADGVDGEIAAMVLAARAVLALERRDRAAAVDRLEAAAQAAHPVSAALAGQLMGQLANAQLDDGGTERAAVTFEAALDLLAGTDLHVSRAELHVAVGALFQERSEAAPRFMAQAIDHYHQAMALVDAATAPETFAVANANLGLAYLMMPMNEASDQLRMGVAVQSMREALTYFTPETHPERWSSTQLNLANALVYLPSKHQADNIAEAVGLYQEVLEQRDAERDPLGRARVLANQGNALAHLGHLDDAASRLQEARSLFVAYDEHDAARTVASLLDDLARHRAGLTRGA
ncbi:MAG: hypothetical protein R2761_09740 [Acidimicrobiales bacterium]